MAKRFPAYILTLCGSIFYITFLTSRYSHNPPLSCTKKAETPCDGLLQFGHDRMQLQEAFAKAGLKTFFSRDLTTCIRRHRHHVRVLLIGDSRMRQLYAELVKLLDPAQDIAIVAGKHEDIVFTDPRLNFTIEFRWLPYAGEDLDRRIQVETANNRHIQILPDLVMVGAAVWTIRYRNATFEAFEEYCRNLTASSVLLNNLAKLTSVLWVAQDPVLEANLAPRRQMITNRVINLYNRAAEVTFCHSHVKVWESGRKLAIEMNSSSDGLHVAPTVARAQIQILLNYWCNLFFPGETDLICSL